MTRSATVMVTGVGGGVGQSILKGLNLAEERRNDVTYRTVGVDADPAASGLFRVDVGYRVPFANADGYVDRLVEVAMKEEVDILVPGSDPEVAVVAENREELAEAGEMEVLVSPPEAVEIGRDKWETYNFLTEHGFKTPNTVLEEDANELVADVGFPLVVKPRTGSASRGLYIVTNQAELDYALGQSAEAVVQEYLIPENWDDNLDKSDLKRQIDEYSSETIVDRDGDIVSTLANWREMDKGVPSVAKVRPHNDVREVCELVVEELDVLGPINLQSRVTSEGVSFFEINTRFTGSTAVRCTAGFNGPDAMVRHLVFGDELSESDLEFENLVEMRYKDEVYVSEEKFEEIKNTGSVVGGGDVQDYY